MTLCKWKCLVIGLVVTTATLANATLAAELPQKDHQAMLNRLSPVFMVIPNPDIGGKIEHPVAISWYVTKTRFVKRQGEGEAEVLQEEEEAPTPEDLVTLIKDTENVGSDHRVQLLPKFNKEQETFVRWGWEETGKTPGEKRIYGAVRPGEGDDIIKVTYFAFYPYSQAEVGLGNHAGDWVCVDFDVSIKNPEQPRITRSIFHNHGRQIMVGEPGDGEAERFLSFTDDGHPLVYPEGKTHELWPTSKGGDDGFADPDDVPTWVYANEKLGDVLMFSGEEYGSRGHDGENPIRFEKVYDVGETSPMKAEGDPDYALFHGPPIRWGTRHGQEVDCPFSPRHQPKMWDRKFEDTVAVRGR